MNKFYSYLYLPHDRFIAVGAYRNNPHGHARFPLDELHISLEFGREILVAAEFAKIAFPPLELFINRRDRSIYRIRETIRTLAADLVGR